MFDSSHADPFTAGGRSAAAGQSDQRLITIRGLLAKAESTEFQAEADAFLAKATELMARYAIDETEVWALAKRGERERPGRIAIRLLAPYTPQKSLMVAAVAGAFGCEAVGERVESGEVVVVVGFPADLRVVEALVTSLLVQAGAAMGRQRIPGTGSQVAAWRRSFLMGFATRVRDRLQAEVATVAAERSPTGSTVALARIERADEVRAAVRAEFPRVRTVRVSLGSSASGRQAGDAAGARADLGRPRVSAPVAIGHG
jgi:hypothetical protein